MNSACTWWVLARRIVSELSISSTQTHWVNAPLPPVPIDDVADVRTGKASPPSLPIPSVQPDHHVSISVTSHVSHTITASPQVSNVINNSVILPSKREVDNPPPSPPKATRPTARKKGSKSSKPTEVTTATAETDPASTTLKKRSQRAKAMPVETTTRTRSGRA